MNEKITWGKQTADYIPFSVGDVPFILVHQNFNKYQTDKEKIVILKYKDFLVDEIEFLQKNTPRTMIEFGLFEGGSAILWHLLFGCRFLGFDILKQPAAIAYWLEKLNLNSHIRLVYETSQDDEARVYEEWDKFFGGQKVDLIIDDASHQFALSRRTLELTLPIVRPGGVYCLEDWSWVHANSATFQVEKTRGDQPALTNLVFEILMLYGSQPKFFKDVYVQGSVVYMTLAHDFEDWPIRLDDHIIKQDRAFKLL